MKWYSKYLSVYEKPYDASAYHKIVSEVKRNLQALHSDNPVATISVIAYNEESHLLACLWSLSNMKCRFPIEIIGVNNNSKDKTEDIYKDVGIRYFNEDKQSCGFARLCGLNNAKGKYHICIDADTLYPEGYAEYIINQFEKNPNVMGINTTWSYIPDESHSPMGIWCYTKLRDIYLWLLSIKRPELCVRAMVFSYRTKEVKEIGLNTNIIRGGDDGYVAFRLKRYGKIKFIRKSVVTAYTGYGTVKESLSVAFFLRLKKAFKRFKNLFTKATEYRDREDNLIKRNKS